MLSKKLEKSKEENKDIDIDQLILRGGSAPQIEEKAEQIKEEHRFHLRIPFDIVEKIDEERKSQGGFISRNTWILQAVIEKLNKTE
jgi:hypothetical protein